MITASRIPLLYALRWAWWYARAHAFELPELPAPLVSRSQSGDVEVGFLGDLMGLGDKKLSLDPSVGEFFGTCQYVCFNLEGLTESSNYPILWRQTTRHFSALEELRRVIAEPTLIAGLANNHIDDVSTLDLAKNITRLNQLGIMSIGTRLAPSIELAPGLRLHAATSWLGKEKTAAHPSDLLNFGQDQHLLFLHHGHEFHQTPRAETRALISGLPASVVGVVGHHTHFPQEIQIAERFVAWSLGNLAVKYGSKPVNWGLALRLVLRQVDGGWRILGHRATYLRNFRRGETVFVGIADSPKRLKI